MSKGIVYLLHFSTPYKHAKHYIGFTKDLESRIQRHLGGDGARLIEVIVKEGITFVVARTWKSKTRGFERRLKNLKNTPRFCPICKEVKCLDLRRED